MVRVTAIWAVDELDWFGLERDFRRTNVIEVEKIDFRPATKILGKGSACWLRTCSLRARCALRFGAA